MSGRLILARRKGQSIRIGEDIFIEVVETHRSSCKLAIVAPSGTIIYRVELAKEGPRGRKEVGNGGES